jgi:hypothetical protein
VHGEEICTRFLSLAVPATAVYQSACPYELLEVTTGIFLAVDPAFSHPCVIVDEFAMRYEQRKFVQK